MNQVARIQINGRSVPVSQLICDLVEELVAAAPDIDGLTVGKVELQVRPQKVSCYVTKGRPPRRRR